MSRPEKPINVCVMVSGSGTNLQSLIDRYPSGPEPDRPARISLVVSDNRQAYGLERAIKAGIETRVIPPGDFASQEEFGTAHIDLFREKEIDLVVLAGYLKLIPSNVVGAFENRMINIHPALLPSFGGKGMYGRRVHEAVIESGTRVSGATVHFVDEKYDHGPILLQFPVPVFSGDDPKTLAKRILSYEHRLLPLAVELIATGRVRVEGRRVIISDDRTLTWLPTFFSDI